MNASPTDGRLSSGSGAVAFERRPEYPAQSTFEPTPVGEVAIPNREMSGPVRPPTDLNDCWCRPLVCASPCSRSDLGPAETGGTWRTCGARKDATTTVRSGIRVERAAPVVRSDRSLGDSPFVKGSARRIQRGGSRNRLGACVVKVCPARCLRRPVRQAMTTHGRAFRVQTTSLSTVRRLIPSAVFRNSRVRESPPRP